MNVVSRDSLEVEAAPSLFDLRSLDRSLIADPAHSTFAQLKLATVPQTLVVQANGLVAFAQPGVLDSSRELSVVNAIDSLDHGGS